MAFIRKIVIDAIWKKICTNKQICDILQLPVLLDTDSQEISEQKTKLLEKYVFKSMQSTAPLSFPQPVTTIDGVDYKNHGQIRVGISTAPTIGRAFEFTEEQVEISVHYSVNKKDDEALFLTDIICNIFTNEWLELGSNFIPKKLMFIGSATQQAIVSNYEKIPLRFSYYTSTNF